MLQEVVDASQKGVKVLLHGSVAFPTPKDFVKLQSSLVSDEFLCSSPGKSSQRRHGHAHPPMRPVLVPNCPEIVGMACKARPFSSALEAGDWRGQKPVALGL